MHKFSMNYVFHFYILRLTSWIWNATLQLKQRNLRALQNETHMRASIVNTDSLLESVFDCSHGTGRITNLINGNKSTLAAAQVSSLQKKLNREIELNQIDHYRIINENAGLVKGINEARNDLKAMRLMESGGGSAAGSESTTAPAPVSAGGGGSSTSDAKEVPQDTRIVDELKAQIQKLQAEVAMKMERIRYLENQMYKQETIRSLPNSKSELPPLDIGT